MNPSLTDMIVTDLLPDSVAAYLGQPALRSGIVEVELAVFDSAETECLIPSGTAAAARKAAETLDLADPGLDRDILAAGREVKPIVDRLGQVLPRDAHRYLHPGLTTQDVVDTANARRWRRACAGVLDELTDLLTDTAHRARELRDLPMLGRTNGLPAAPLTYGYRLARHLDAWLNIKERLERASQDIAVAQLGGAVGLASPWGENTAAVWAGVATRLGLRLPDISWHTDRSRIEALADALCMLSGMMARLGAEVIELGATGEVFEGSAGDGLGGSSAMPHKRNPRLSERLEILGALAEARMSEMLFAARHTYDRSAARAIVETDTLDRLFAIAGASVAAARRLVPILTVSPDAAQAQLDTGGGIAYTEMQVEALAATIGYPEARKTIAKALAAMADGESLDHALARECATAGISEPYDSLSLRAKAAARGAARTDAVVTRIVPKIRIQESGA